MSSLKICFAAAGLLAAAASAASATTVGLAAYETGYVDGRHVYIDPLTLDGRAWFCISPDLDIALGAQPYVYSLASLTPANSLAVTEHALTSTQIGEIGALVGKGYADITAHASGAQISADASAIWAIEGSTVTADNAATGSLILADISWAMGRSSHFVVMTNTSGVQNVGGVPEPSTWTMMIIGFALVGGISRSRVLRGIPVRA